MSSYNKLAGTKKAFQKKTNKIFQKTEQSVKAASDRLTYSYNLRPKIKQRAIEKLVIMPNENQVNILDMDCLIFYGKNARQEDWTYDELQEFIQTSYIADHEDNYFRARKINSVDEINKHGFNTDFPWMRFPNRKFYIELDQNINPNMNSTDDLLNSKDNKKSTLASKDYLQAIKEEDFDAELINSSPDRFSKTQSYKKSNNKSLSNKNVPKNRDRFDLSKSREKTPKQNDKWSKTMPNRKTSKSPSQANRSKSPYNTLNKKKNKKSTPENFTLQHEIFHKVEKQAKDLQDMMYVNKDDGMAPTRLILHELENLAKTQYDELKSCWDKR